MVNTNLELNINTLKQYTITMIGLCEEAVDNATSCMIRKDLAGCKKVIEQDDEIDELREYITDRSIELIALRQPMAKDLRYVYSLGNIAMELERIGDYATNIAMEALKIGEEPYIKELVDIPKMAQECKKMLTDVALALENADAKLCYEIAKRDDEIDDLYRHVHIDCLNLMHKEQATLNQGVRLLFVGRYLERIGDHITNVCEKIIYAVSGDRVEIG